MAPCRPRSKPVTLLLVQAITAANPNAWQLLSDGLEVLAGRLDSKEAKEVSAFLVQAMTKTADHSHP